MSSYIERVAIRIAVTVREMKLWMGALVFGVVCFAFGAIVGAAIANAGSRSRAAEGAPAAFVQRGATPVAEPAEPALKPGRAKRACDSLVEHMEVAKCTRGKADAGGESYDFNLLQNAGMGAILEVSDKASFAKLEAAPEIACVNTRQRLVMLFASKHARQKESICTLFSSRLAELLEER